MHKIFKYPELHYIYYKSKVQLLLSTSTYKKWFAALLPLFEDKTGLEIGGPSHLFSTEIIPVYAVAKQVDGCNYSSQTVWEGEIKSGDYNYFENKKGKQFILEGTDLSSIPDGRYDFVLSCHNLEHIANPMKALSEWNRILKPGGTIFIVVPDKRFTFDRQRHYTELSHILADYANDIGESDLTHLEEVVRLHDMKMDPPLNNDRQVLEERCKDNITNRCIHHHVYSHDLLNGMFEALHIKTLSRQFVPPYNTIIVGQKK